MNRLGDEESARHIYNQKLFQHYQQLLSASRLEIIYSGSCEESRVENALQEALAMLPRGTAEELLPAQLRLPPSEPRYVPEEMDVTQGKLAMGFRCLSDDIPAMIMVNLLFGGSSNSKLFLNVREKLSLCYYASSSYHRSKGNHDGVPPELKRKTTQKHMTRFCTAEEPYWGDGRDWEIPGALSTNAQCTAVPVGITHGA